jgi:hypothetical protein
MTYEYALVRVSATEAARVPLPVAQTPEDRDAFLAALALGDLAAYERWPVPSLPDAPIEPPTTDTPDAGDEDDV